MVCSGLSGAFTLSLVCPFELWITTWTIRLPVSNGTLAYLVGPSMGLVDSLYPLPVVVRRVPVSCAPLWKDFIRYSVASVYGGDAWRR